MKYHTLSFKKDRDAVSEPPKFLYWIVFDGNHTDCAFDEIALKASSEKDGVYPLVVCGCGYIGCNGMYVTTRIEKDDVIWEKFWQGQCCGETEKDDELSEFSLIKNSAKGKNITLKPPVKFHLGEYRDLIETIEHDIKSDPISSKEYDEALSYYKDGNVFRM